jgi:poly(A) polymerase
MAIRRLAILSADAAQARTALRLSNAQSNALQICRDEMGTLRAAHALAYDYGASLARDILYLRAALFETQPMPQDIADIELAKDAVFPVMAADLMPDFQGPDLGRRLRQLTHDWVASKFTLTRDELRAKGPEHDD